MDTQLKMSVHLGSPAQTQLLTCQLLGFVGLGIQQPGVSSISMTNLQFNTVAIGLAGNVILPVEELTSYH